MRSKILGILTFLLLPCILLAAGLTLPQLYQESYYAELVPMTDRLERTEGKKLVLVGGSNIAFGVDGNLLEQLLRDKGFDYTVCPYGFYAAVGTDAMLSLSACTLKAGDVIVLAIEPSNDTFTPYFGATAFLKAAEGRPDLIIRLDAGQRVQVAGNLIPYIQEKLSIIRSGIYPSAEGVYAKNAFDNNCTMIYDRPGNRMSLGYDTAVLIDLDAVSIDPAFAERINSYIRLAREKGADVCLSFSPMNRSAVRGSLPDFFAMLNQVFDCRIISDPGRYVLDSGWFYDSNFHLNSAGQAVRTCLLAEDLLADWGCYEPLGYELPVMPDPDPVQPKTAEDSGADYVTEILEGGSLCRITGLTESAKNKTVLVIPSSIGGLTVADIAEDALESADELEELHIPETVETLPDYMMVHCPGLKRLVLTHTSAPCGLREHSLDGAGDLQILVPAAAYSWYRDGYGCEENPWLPWIRQIVAY